MTFDLSSITVTDSDESLGRKPGAGRPKIDNPFGDVIADSWGKRADGQKVGTTKILTVVNDKERGNVSRDGEKVAEGMPKNVVTILGLIRRAADDQNLGVVINTDETKNKTTIKFAAKVKTERKRRDVSDVTSAETVPA